MAGPSNRGGAALAAAPAWRNFTFFNQSPLRSPNPTSSLLSQPVPITSVGSAPSSSLVVVGDNLGQVHIVDDQLEPTKSWKAHQDGRTSHLVVVEGAGWEGVVVSVGDEASSPSPVLKIWDTLPTPPVLLRSTRLTPASASSRAPLSALAVAPSLAHIILGFADGSVLSFRHPDQLTSFSRTSPPLPNSPPLSLGKLRLIHSATEPITALALATPPPPSRRHVLHNGHANGNGNGNGAAGTTLYILTTNNVWATALSASSKGGTGAGLDELGAGVGCGGLMETSEGGRMVVAKEEAIYVYGPEGREACFAYEGFKSKVLVLSPSISSVPTSSARSTYLAIVSPPRTPTPTPGGRSARQLNGTPSDTAGSTKLTIFDPENKLVAFTTTFDEGISEVWEAWGEVWVLTEGGKLFRLKEQALAASLSTLFSRNLYTLAVSLAQSRALPPSEVAEIYRRYGDYLYAKADYEGAINCYLKTIGTVQPSYVIRKFLDAQRLVHLTSYLQELHSAGLANSDHTTLLLNCYTKLADDKSLASFLHSSSAAPPSSSALAPVPDTGSGSAEVAEPPFDLETAIRVCRQAGFFEHAVWLAERYGAHADFLRIQIEDVGDVGAALRYLRGLGAEVAEDNLVRYGQTLMGKDAEGTTELLIDLCCGTLVKADQARVEGYHVDEGVAGSRQATDRAPRQITSPTPPDSAPAHSPARTASPELSPLERAQASPNPRQFFAHFVDHPVDFVHFLETVAARRFGKKLDARGASRDRAGLPEVGRMRMVDLDDVVGREEQAVWNTLLELYLSTDPAAVEADGARAGTTSRTKAELEANALELLRSRDEIAYDDTQALLVCTTLGFTAGFVLLYEQLGMYDDIVRYWIDTAQLTPQSTDASVQVLAALKRYGQGRPYLYRLVLRFLSSSEELLGRHSAELGELLDEIERDRILDPIAVVQVLSRAGLASVGVVREYLKRHLAAERDEAASDLALIESYRAESSALSIKAAALADPRQPQVFQATRCASCAGQLALPAVHFMCQHSYHERCLPEGAVDCPNCEGRHGLVREVRRAGEGWLGRQGEWKEEVREAGAEGEGWAKVAEGFGWGLMRKAEE